MMAVAKLVDEVAASLVDLTLAPTRAIIASPRGCGKSVGVSKTRGDALADDRQWRRHPQELVIRDFSSTMREGAFRSLLVLRGVSLRPLWVTGIDMHVERGGGCAHRTMAW